MARHAVRRQLLRQRLIIAAFLVVAFFATSAYLLDRVIVGDDPATTAAEDDAPPTTAPADPTPAPLEATGPPETAAPETPEPAATDPGEVLSLDEDVPPDGPGSFRYAGTEGEVLGEAGQLRRFRVGVEENVVDDLVELDDLVEFVDETLGADEGWTAGGDLRFQRVPDGAAHDFTIYLATGETTDRLCSAGGLQIMAPGLPDGGVSCRVAGQVVLNLNRWQQSVEHYHDEQVPLAEYRRMVLNHEVGHELGYGHEACTGEQEPAPVMQQQTLFLDGCEANPWPYVDGQRHTGPPVP